MRRSVLTWGVIGFTACAVTLALASGGEAPEAKAQSVSDGSATRAPRLALLSGVPGDTTTQLLFVVPGGGSPPKLQASFDHLPEAVVRGAVLPGSDSVLVVADTLPSRERSWSASLLLLEPGKPVRRLADRVYHATRPLVTPSGRVFVQRGTAGTAPTAPSSIDRLRVDDLTIDEVDPASGGIRTLVSWQGYETHLAGSIDDDLVVYRVGPAGADLIAVHVDTGSSRVLIAKWPPMARDFSVDASGRAIVAQQLDPGPPRRWVVERIDAATGSRSVLAASRHRDLVPYAWPGGGVLVNAETRRRAEVVGAAIAISPPVPDAALWLRATSDDAAWAAGVWLRPGSLPSALALRASDGLPLAIPTQEGHRVEVAGFVGGGS